LFEYDVSGMPVSTFTDHPPSREPALELQIAQGRAMTLLIPAEEQARTPIRIFRGAAERDSPIAFQPEWAPFVSEEMAGPDQSPREADAAADLVSPRWFELTRSIVLSASVSAFVTLVLTVRAVGLGPDLTQVWLATLKLSLLIGLPARFLFEPYAARLVGLFVAPPAPSNKGFHP
jgi:hypothetical protein